MFTQRRGYQLILLQLCTGVRRPQHLKLVAYIQQAHGYSPKAYNTDFCLGLHAAGQYK